jgi:hypothetical protein
MQQPIVISFYTVKTPYEEEVKKLIESCITFGIDADIEGITSVGSWEKNCALKSSFIRQQLDKWNRPVLWVDADAAFLRKPDFADFADVDFAVRVNEFLPKTHESRVVSNTIFVRNNALAISALEKWNELSMNECHRADRAMEFWDQTALRDALEQFPALKFMPMPLKFAKIFDFDDLFISEKEIVIEHYQASRRFKNRPLA